MVSFSPSPYSSTPDGDKPHPLSSDDIRAAFQTALQHADELPDQIADRARNLIIEAIEETKKSKPRLKRALGQTPLSV